MMDSHKKIYQLPLNNYYSEFVILASNRLATIYKSVMVTCEENNGMNCFIILVFEWYMAVYVIWHLIVQ